MTIYNVNVEKIHVTYIFNKDKIYYVIIILHNKSAFSLFWFLKNKFNLFIFLRNIFVTIYDIIRL